MNVLHMGKTFKTISVYMIMNGVSLYELAIKTRVPSLFYLTRVTVIITEVPII